MKLVVLTYHYPYGKGEEFIDSEIDYLSDKFDRITVLSGGDLTQRKRSTPDNVEIVNITKDYNLTGIAAYTFKKMLSADTVKELGFMKSELSQKLSLKNIKLISIYHSVSQRYLCWIKKNINKNDEEYIFYSYWLSSGAYTLSRLKKLGYKGTMISRAHGYDAFLDRGYQPFRKEIYKYLDQIHFISEVARVKFKDKINLDAIDKKAMLLTSRLGTVNSTGMRNPERSTSEAGSFHIVTCSSIIQLKRLDLLVDALQILQQHNIVWTHFGDGPLRGAIEEQIRHKLEASKIKIKFRGYVQNQEVRQFYENNHVDLFANISDTEGVPVSIMEAISYGIPVIARDVGGNCEIVSNDDGMLISGRDSAQDVADAILYFMSLTEEEIQKYRTGAYQIWRQQYYSKINYEKFYKTITKVSQ